MFNDYTHPTEFTMHRPGVLEGMQFYVDLSVMQGVAPRLLHAPRTEPAKYFRR